jgi:hypothetical protein
MKIQEQTATRLVICTKPVGTWMFASIFFLMELYMLFFGPEIPPDTSQSGSIQWIVIPLMVCTGLFFSNWVAIITCRFDKETNQFIFEKDQILTRQIIEKPLTEIEALELSQPDSEGQPIHPVYVQLSSGEKLPVYTHLSLFSATNWFEQQKTVAKTLQEFLEL